MAEPDHGNREVTGPGDEAERSSTDSPGDEAERSSTDSPGDEAERSSTSGSGDGAERSSTNSPGDEAKRKRRRASRAAGPPQDVGKTEPATNPGVADGQAPGDAPSSADKPGKVKPTGKPVKSAPVGRKRKSAPTPPASKAAPASDEVGGSTGSSTDDDAVVSTGVSYRERRSAARGDSGRPRKTKGRVGKADRPSTAAKKRVGLRGMGVVLAAITAVGLIAAMAVASTLFVLGTKKIDDRNELRAEYSAFARQMVTNLTTLNPQNIDGAIKSFQDDTSGKAMEQVGQSVQQTVNMIKSENVSTKGAVISEAVTASDSSTASVIMVFSWEMNQPNVTDQQTVLQVFRWKLEITRINGELKLTNVEWVT